MDPESLAKKRAQDATMEILMRSLNGYLLNDEAIPLASEMISKLSHLLADNKTAELHPYRPRNEEFKNCLGLDFYCSELNLGTPEKREEFISIMKIVPKGIEILPMSDGRIWVTFDLRECFTNVKST